MRQVFIDEFNVPKEAYEEFVRRMNYNRNFIRKLKGFIEDRGFFKTDEKENVTVITMAIWESEEVLNSAKEAVQAEYKRIGFNPAEMMERLHIIMKRDIYFELEKPD